MIMEEAEAPRCDTGPDDVCCHEKEVGCNWWYIGGSATQVRLRCFLLFLIILGMFIFYTGQYLLFYEMTTVHRLDMTITTQTTSTTTTSTTTTTTTTTTPKPYYEKYYLFLNYCRFKRGTRRSHRSRIESTRTVESQALISNKSVDDKYLKTNPENILSWLQGAGQHSEIKLPKQRVQKKQSKMRTRKISSKIIKRTQTEDESREIDDEEILPKCNYFVIAGSAMLVGGPILTAWAAYFFTNRNLDHMVVTSPDCTCDFTSEKPPEEPPRVPDPCGVKTKELDTLPPPRLPDSSPLF